MQTAGLTRAQLWLTAFNGTHKRFGVFGVPSDLASKMQDADKAIALCLSKETGGSRKVSEWR